MANASKQKGTAGETELLRLLELEGMVRTAPTLPFDLCRPGWNPPIEVLATRPDRGQWLITLTLSDFKRLMLTLDAAAEPFVTEVHVEVKRYRRFSLHTIFNSKFGEKK